MLDNEPTGGETGAVPAADATHTDTSTTTTRRARATRRRAGSAAAAAQDAAAEDTGARPSRSAPAGSGAPEDPSPGGRGPGDGQPTAGEPSSATGGPAGEPAPARRTRTRARKAAAAPETAEGAGETRRTARAGAADEPADASGAAGPAGQPAQEKRGRAERTARDEPTGAGEAGQEQEKPATRTRRKRATSGAQPAPLAVVTPGEQAAEAAQPPTRRRAPAATVLFMAPETIEPSAPPAAEPVAATKPDTPPAEEGRSSRRRRSRRAESAEPAAATQTTAGQTTAGQTTAGQTTAGRQEPAEPEPARKKKTAKKAAPAEPAPVEEQAEPAEDHGEESDEEDAGGRKRRRRGRRGRGRGKGNGDEDNAGDEATPADGGGEEAAAEGEAVTRRRRRRRRGSGGDAETTSEDGVVTVVKVRSGRTGRDEIQGVSGSTRLEAKRQRRRDGRDSRRTRPPVLSESEFLARRESVERSMVVRQRGDRTQIGVLEDGVLVEHYVTRVSAAGMVGNVYLGKVQNVLPSMEAAFVDVGRGRNAVLYAGEVNWDATGLEGRARSIEQALKAGDSVLVQVTKDPIGHKGARLTSHIALSGRHLVYVPHGNASGISRKLPDTERKRLRDILKSLVPDGAGVIVRTAAEGASEEDLARDVDRLRAQWEDIQAKAGSKSAPVALYEEPDLVIRVVRDLFNEDFRDLVVQGDGVYDTVEQYLTHVSPDLVGRLRRHTGTADVFAEHRIDEQILKGLDRKVFLPSGGYLVIDRTEAMTVIDVNTGKYTGTGGNLEETVTRNNLEAAEEIVRQLRLRDLGGIIVVDFIDMVLESNRELVLRRLTECLGRDRTKHQVTEITSLGLVQMTRKRIGQGLLEAFSETCEHCKGRGLLIHTEPAPERRSTAKAAAKAAAAVAAAEPGTTSRRRGRKAAAGPAGTRAGSAGAATPEPAIADESAGADGDVAVVAVPADVAVSGGVDASAGAETPGEPGSGAALEVGGAGEVVAVTAPADDGDLDGGDEGDPGAPVLGAPVLDEAEIEALGEDGPLGAAGGAAEHVADGTSPAGGHRRGRRGGGHRRTRATAADGSA